MKQVFPILFLSLATNEHAGILSSDFDMPKIDLLMQCNGFIAKYRHLQNVFSCNVMIS